MHQPLSLTHAILTLLFLIPTCLSVIIPHCFFPGESPDLQPTNLDDCKGALRELVGEPGKYRILSSPNYSAFYFSHLQILEIIPRMKRCVKQIPLLTRPPSPNVGFIDHYRFSRNQRIGVKVPKWWRSGECIILVSCSTKYDAETLSYADVLRSAKKVIDQVGGSRFRHW